MRPPRRARLTPPPQSTAPRHACGPRALAHAAALVPASSLAALPQERFGNGAELEPIRQPGIYAAADVRDWYADPRNAYEQPAWIPEENGNEE